MKNNHSKTSVYLLVMSLVASFSFCISSCKKETTTINYLDTTIVAKWMTKKWNLLSNELESYSGTNLTGKKQDNYNGLGYFQEFKTGGSTSFFDLGGASTGTWKLLSSNYYVLDQNTAGERYYYIESISESNLVIRGPFTKTNQIYSNFLITAYLRYP